MRKKRIVVLLVAVVLLLGQAAAAHQSVDPESTLIPFHMQVLENGLRVIVKEIPSYPIAVANVWVGVGAKDDPDGLSGMAHFFEHLMFQGTPSRPLGQIWQETALLGGDINAATSLDFTFYYIVVPSEHIRQAMEIQADALRNSLFDQAQIDRERQVIQEEISMVRESLQTYLLHSSLQELFAGTSYGKPIPGTLEDLARVNRTEILDFYARYYVPNNMVLVVAGNVVAEEIFALARELYGDLEPRPLPPPEYIEVPILERVVHKEEERPVRSRATSCWPILFPACTPGRPRPWSWLPSFWPRGARPASTGSLWKGNGWSTASPDGMKVFPKWASLSSRLNWSRDSGTGFWRSSGLSCSDSRLSP